MSIAEELLGFTLDPFLRVAWVSREAQTSWASVLARVLRVKRHAKYQRLVEGSEQVMLTGNKEEAGVQYAGIVSEELSDSEELTQLEMWQLSGARMAGNAPLYITGTAKRIARFRRLVTQGSADSVLTMLGVPSCCNAAAIASSVPDLKDNILCTLANVESQIPLKAYWHSPPELNILWERLGLALVGHQLCSPTCSPSGEKARRWLSEIAVLDSDSAEALGSLLRWPVERTLLHGIAEVKTPILKFVSDGLATRSCFSVKFEGSRYPEVGGRGVKFPYLRESVINQHLLTQITVDGGLS